MARYMRTDVKSYGNSRLSPPAIVGAGIVFAPLMVTYSTRTNRLSFVSRPTYSKLNKPAVVGAGIVFSPLKKTFNSGVDPYRRKQHSKLQAPVVVNPVPPTVAYAPITAHLTYSVRKRGSGPKLQPPVVIRGPVAFFGPRVQITFSKTRKVPAYPKLSPPPTVLGGGIAFLGPRVRTVLGPVRKIQSRASLNPPQVVYPAGVAFYGPKIQTVRGRAGKAHGTILLPPVVIRGPVAFFGPRVRVTFSKTQKVQAASRLGPPLVVNPVGTAFYGPTTSLTYSSRKIQSRADLNPPTVVLLPLFFGPRVSFVRGRAGVTKPVLRIPVVINSAVAFFGPLVTVTFSKTRRVQAAAKLGLPLVVNPVGTAFYGPTTSLTYSSRKIWARTLLGAPVVVLHPVSFGPETHVVRGRAGVPHSLLRTPVVVQGASAFYGPRVRVVLGPVRRIQSRAQLNPPTTVIPPGTAWYGPKTITVRGKRGVPKSLLRAPVVVQGASAFFGPRVTYTRIRKKVQAQTQLRAPTVVNAFVPPVAFYGPTTTFVRGKAGATRAVLRTPVVVQGGVAYEGPRTALAPSRRGVPHSVLHTPTVVTTPSPVLYPISTSLVVGKRIRGNSHLSGPVVIQGPVAFDGVLVFLTRGPLPITRAKLNTPTVVTPATPQPLARPVAITVTRGRKGATASKLTAPQLVFSNTGIFGGPGVMLAPSTRGVPRHRLYAPVVVSAQVQPLARPIRVAFVRSQRGVTKPHLFVPAVVGAGVVFRPVDITIARIVPPKRFWKLSPPTVLAQPPAFLPPEITRIVRGRAGHARPLLSPPAVVGAGIVFRPLKSTLVRGRAGAPKSRLFPAVIPPLARAVAVTIARTKFGIPKPRLTPPGPPPPTPRPIDATFAARAFDPRRAQHSRLAAPVVVGAPFVSAPIQTHVTRGKAGLPKSKLFAPAVINPPPPVRPLQLFLVRGRAGTSKPKLRPPAVVGGGIVFRPIKKTFGYPFDYRRRSHPKLKPPAVIGAGITFRGILTHLAAVAERRQISGIRYRYFVHPPGPGRLLLPYCGKPGTMWVIGKPDLVWVVRKPIKMFEVDRPRGVQ